MSKLWLGYVVGDRSLVYTQLLIHIIAALLAPGCVPVFFSDGWSAYGTALLTHFGHWVEMPRRHKRGASPKPRWRPLPELHYAQVVKKREKGRVVSVTHRVIYGSLEAITTMLTTYYNFCLPHFALRLPLLLPVPTKGNGSLKMWQSRSPAMAAGITDHVCRLEELLLFRPPPWQQPVAVAA